MFSCSNGHSVWVGGSTKFASTKNFAQMFRKKVNETIVTQNCSCRFMSNGWKCWNWLACDIVDKWLKHGHDENVSSGQMNEMFKWLQKKRSPICESLSPLRGELSTGAPCIHWAVIGEAELVEGICIRLEQATELDFGCYPWFQRLCIAREFTWISV